MPSFGRISTGAVTTPLPHTIPSHEMVSGRAYLIWQTHGCPDGTAVEDWLQAEAELKAELGQGRWA